MKNNTIVTLTLLLLCVNIVKAQDLLNQLYFEEKKQVILTESTFKTLRIGFAHSIETRKKGILEVSVYTRYWNIPEIDGVEVETNNFGSDRASARFGLDYAINNNLSAGIGGSNEGVFDGYFKYRLIRQTTGARKTPFSLTVVAAQSYRSKNLENVSLSDNPRPSDIYNNSIPKTAINKNGDFIDKTTFAGQLLLARKLDPKLSVQLSPTFIYRGSTTFEQDPKFQFAVGIGGRYKLGKHVSVASEYFYVPKPFALESIETFGPFSLGINWEVSKVLIQMFFTHTGAFSEDQVITETPVNFNSKDGNLFFGWNFSYVFHLKKNK